jgi:succinate dehydrogenase / fumarate reductase cytochrome b subunit
MVLSILHRMTGVAMSIGLIVLASWLMQAAAGPEAYLGFSMMMSSLVGKLLLIGWSFAFFFHAANGVRHLVWDTGRGFDKRQADRSAWFVIIFAVVVTGAFWWAVS